MSASASLQELSGLYSQGDIGQCSSYPDDYCFLCNSVDPAGSDGNAAAIRSIVEQLAVQKK